MEPALELIESSTTPAVSRQPDSKRRRAADPKAYGRNKITNGGSMLPTTDGRSLWARIRRDTYNAIINSHLGGPDMVSETQSLMARRVGTLEAELIFIEDKFASIRAAGGEPDTATLELYGRLADRQRRLADPLGWQRHSRDVTVPDPLQYARDERSND